jgi:hypothetical protein
MNSFHEAAKGCRYALPGGRNDQAKIAGKAEIESLR